MNRIIALQHFLFRLPTDVRRLGLRILAKPDEQVFELVHAQLLDVPPSEARILPDAREKIPPMRLLAFPYVRFFLNEDRPRNVTTICRASSMSSHASICSRLSR